MKKNKTINIIIILLFLSSVVSCLSGGGEKKSAEINIIASNLTIPEGVVDSGIAAKTFNQFNMTLSKLTGIDVGESNVNAEYLLIRNSLPAGHKPSSFTPFHQVAVTRLAFAYCDVFIDDDSQFSSLDYGTLSPAEITVQLLDRLIGIRTPSNAAYYDGISSQINEVMNNNAGNDEEGDPIGALIPNGTGANLKINLTKLSCTTLLGSSTYSVL
ncbi:MAG: hypothetical protein HN576_06550 [Bacteriovoracaceae bacterium]|jgi:hypothetical protein|nr:hypothetical protein [Bacteriovoracaceae bacterium]